MAFEKLAVHEVNKWLWAQLQELGVMTNVYNGMQPIIPGQQMPEFTNMYSGRPFIVYQYWPARTAEWWIKKDTIRYDIYTESEEKSRKIFHAMLALFERTDDAPDEIAAWSSDPNIEVKTIKVLSAQSSEPLQHEGGRTRTRLFIEVGYTQEIDSETVYDVTNAPRNLPL